MARDHGYICRVLGRTSHLGLELQVVGVTEMIRVPLVGTLLRAAVGLFLNTSVHHLGLGDERCPV